MCQYNHILFLITNLEQLRNMGKKNRYQGIEESTATLKIVRPKEQRMKGKAERNESISNITSSLTAHLPKLIVHK